MGSVDVLLLVSDQDREKATKRLQDMTKWIISTSNTIQTSIDGIHSFEIQPYSESLLLTYTDAQKTAKLDALREVVEFGRIVLEKQSLNEQDYEQESKWNSFKIALEDLDFHCVADGTRVYFDFTIRDRKIRSKRPYRLRSWLQDFREIDMIKEHATFCAKVTFHI